MDFSSKTPSEIREFIQEHKHEKLCGRFSNDQLRKPVLLEIPFRTLGNRMTASQIFLVSLLFVFGTTLFSCTTHKNETVDKLVLTEMNIPGEQETFTTGLPVIVETHKTKGEIEIVNPEEIVTPADTIDLPAAEIVGDLVPVIDGGITGLMSITYSETKPPSSQDIDSVNKIRIDDVNENANMHVIETSLVYPNPAHGVVNLKFNVQTEKNVTAELFDLNGKLIRTLIPSQLMQIGERDVRLNVEDLKPATYLLRLITGDSVETKRVVIL
jgi:hypothetical protein